MGNTLRIIGLSKVPKPNENREYHQVTPNILEWPEDERRNTPNHFNKNLIAAYIFLKTAFGSSWLGLRKQGINEYLYFILKTKNIKRGFQNKYFVYIPTILKLSPNSTLLTLCLAFNVTKDSAHRKRSNLSCRHVALSAWNDSAVIEFYFVACYPGWQGWVSASS